MKISTVGIIFAFVDNDTNERANIEYNFETHSCDIYYGKNNFHISDEDLKIVEKVVKKIEVDEENKKLEELIKTKLSECFNNTKNADKKESRH